MNDLLQTLAQPAVFPWAAIVLGLTVGSFLNVVLHRLPKMMQRDWERECAELAGEREVAQPGKPGGAAVPQSRSDETPYNLLVPPSACPACGHAISAAENIPLV